MTIIKKNSIALLGIGKAGIGTVDRLRTEGIDNITLITAESDALYNLQAPLVQILNEEPEIVFIVTNLDERAGTGNTAALARAVKEAGILTIGFVVTTQSAADVDTSRILQSTLAIMKQFTDATFELPNEKLRDANGQLPQTTAKASEYIASVVCGIAEIVTIKAEVNVDLIDVRTVLERADKALVGTAVADGQNRAMEAAQQATDFSLLAHADMAGAGRILLSITSGVTAELDMEELVEITEYIQDRAGEQAEVIFGHAIDESLQDSIRVTLIASCFSEN